MGRKSRLHAASLSAETKSEIVRRYSAGELCQPIATAYGVSVSFVLGLVTDSGVPKFNKADRPRKLSLEQKSGLIADYQAGMSFSEVGIKYGIKRCSAWELLNRRGMTRSPLDSCKNPTLRMDAFDELTEESAYWLGFLLTDGCLYFRNRRYTISVTLSTRDHSHLERFKSFMKSKTKITTLEKTNVSNVWLTCSDRLAEKLINWGIVPRKTHTALAHPSLASHRDFWRGAIDGDGSLFMARKDGFAPVINFVSANKPFVEQFASYVKTVFPECNASVSKGRGTWDFRVSGQIAVGLAQHLYIPSTISLDRKMVIANEWNARKVADPNLCKPHRPWGKHTEETKEKMRQRRMLWWKNYNALRRDPH